MQHAPFSDLRSLSNLRASAIARLKQQPIPTVMYGAGSYAATVRRYLEKHDVTISDCFIDSHYQCPHDVFHFEDMLARYPRFNVVIGIADHRRGVEQVKKIANGQVEHIESFVLSPHYLDDINSEFLEQHAEELQTIYSWLGDELSRRTLTGYVSTIVSGDDSYLFDICQPSQYFQDIAPIGDRAIIVDGGAFVGDTLEEVVRRQDGKFSKYYAFEPDGPNFARLSAMVKEHNYRSVECINAGLWRQSGTMRFAESTSGSTESKISDSGEVEITLDTIDRRCADATFIKMDIEGAELDALHGARQTIERNKPTLAVCAYHNPVHLWTLADYTRSLVPEYKLYLRQHRTICTELVLYASC